MRRLLISLLLLLLPAVATAQAAPPSLDTYEDWLRTAYAAATRSDRIGLDAVAAQLQDTSAVQLADGTTVAVDNRWLADALAQEPPDYDQISGRLGAFLDALGQPENDITAGDAQQQLDQVFNQPPFVNRAVPNFIERMVQRFLDWLSGVLPTFGGATPAGFSALTPLGWTLLIVGLLLVLGLLLYAVRGVRVSVRRGQQARQAAEERDLSPTDAWERAQELVRGGDYRAAVRYLYLHSLLWLDERKLLRYDRSKTNREYLQQVRENQRLHDQLKPVVTTFDRVWYGKRPIDPDQFQVYQQQVEALRREEPSA